MHKDHINWVSEIEMWEQDIRMWYQELEALRNALTSIKEACEEHEKGLDAHLRSIKRQHGSVQLAESYLAMIEPGGYPDADLNTKHEEKRRLQIIHRDAHDRLKRYQHLIMILTRQMKNLLEGPI